MMQRYLSLLILLFISTFALAKDVYVKGYTRSDGTHVRGHYRSAPDGTINNNFSTKGNVNPYTGKEGWIPRESSTTSSYYTSSSSSPSYASNSSRSDNTSSTINLPIIKTNKIHASWRSQGALRGVANWGNASFVASKKTRIKGSYSNASMFVLNIDSKKLSAENKARLRNSLNKCELKLNVGTYTKNISRHYAMPPYVTSKYFLYAFFSEDLMQTIQQFERFTLRCTAGSKTFETKVYYQKLN